MEPQFIEGKFSGNYEEIDNPERETAADTIKEYERYTKEANS